MSKQPLYMFRNLAAALALSLAVCSPVMAMGGYAGGQVIKGVIENIDYQHHSITVNGQTYTVAPTAKYNGVAGFSVLAIGMPVQIMLGETATASSSGPGPTTKDPMPNTAPNTQQTNPQPQVIVGITWLPGGIH
jgi:hypothetical protein